MQPASSLRHLQVLAALHQVLDVVDGWEEQVEDLEEVVFLLREPRVRQELHQVAEVVAAEGERRGTLFRVQPERTEAELSQNQNLAPTCGRTAT